MAFNLNKNEGAKPATKFDLSKSNPSAGGRTEQERSRSKTWLFALLGLLVIGITAWYFLSGPSAAPGSNTADTAPGNQDKATAPPVNSTADVKAENEGTSTAAAITATSINNRVPATFAKGSNSISSLDESLVKDIMAFLEKNPGSVINVNGYASSEGELAVNQKISQARADAFKRYLVSKGINSTRINSIGKGIDDPIGSNDTEEGRVKNRRVEISLQ